MNHSMDIARHRLNKVLQLNLMFLLAHFVLYGGTRSLLLSLHNPFADFVVVLGFVSLIGLWLCFDFLVPVFCEAVRHRDHEALRPIGWMMVLSALAFVAGAYQIVPMA